MKPELETIVGERVSALRKLKNNPHDKGALSTIFKVQQQVCDMLHARSGLQMDADWLLFSHVLGYSADTIMFASLLSLCSNVTLGCLIGFL